MCTFYEFCMFDRTYKLRGQPWENVFKTSPRNFVRIVDFRNFRFVIIA